MTPGAGEPPAREKLRRFGPRSCSDSSTAGPLVHVGGLPDAERGWVQRALGADAPAGPGPNPQAAVQDRRRAGSIAPDGSCPGCTPPITPGRLRGGPQRRTRPLTCRFVGGHGLHNTNRHHSVEGQPIAVSPIRATVTDSRPNCRQAALDAIDRLQQRTGATKFTRRDIVVEVQATDANFERQTIYRCIRRMTGHEPGSAYHDLRDLGNDRLQVRR